MSGTEWLGRLLGLERGTAIGRVEPSLAAPWAHDAPAWLLFGALAVVIAAAVFYSRFQSVRPAAVRIVLTAFRASVACLILLILAEPVVTISVSGQRRPALWILFDGTDSMGIADELGPAEAARLGAAVGWPSGNPSDPSASAAPVRPTRIDYLKALLKKPDGNLLRRLEQKFRLRFFLLDQPDGVRRLEPSAQGEPHLDPDYLADQLLPQAQVTALGAGLLDVARRQSGANLAGLVVMSDFNQNAGPPALEAAGRLGVPLYTVGIGPATAVDLAVDLQCPPTMKKDERYPLVVTLRQEGLDGHSVRLTCSVRKLEGSAASSPETRLAQRDVLLERPTQIVEIPFTPTETGRLGFVAQVEPLPDEVVAENNRAGSDSQVHDHFLRVLFVEYEPTWEWRFVKEVFHRDRLVGPQGFRTFLRSADPKVRQSGELFVATLTLPRSEFFQYDVILVGDLPASALSNRFCQMVEEFVDKLGGGLVVVAGPRFGPGQLAATPLADMLPVKPDPALRLRDRQPFTLQRTAEAAGYDFMQLDSGADNDRAWESLGPIPWYQPVERLHALATALAVHPEDRCVDGKTPQPLIAVRRYGRGEVVYLAFNEFWRLRRLWGERYYRQFWGQLIHRLASRHALGSQKRFVVRTDRKQYRAEEEVLVTVEAYDADYQPLAEDRVPGRKLAAELLVPPGESLNPTKPRTLTLAPLRQGIFEARFTVFSEGEHRVRVRDPITQEFAETAFRVLSVPIERRQATRNTSLQQALADATGGRSYDLATVHDLPDQVQLAPRTETNVEVIPLGSTWLVFALVSCLLLGEWAARKRVNLP